MQQRFGLSRCICKKHKIICVVDISYSLCGILFARGEMVIVVGNGHGDTSSNPGRD